MKFQTALLSFFTAALLVSCSSGTPETPEEAPVAEVKKEPFDKRVKHEVETMLQILANEKYEMKVYKEQLTSDGIEDAIITVNRKQFAEQEIIREGKLAKSADLGFMGYYNYVIYYDGGRDRINEPVKIASSPARTLDLQFENITSPSKKDVVISYRIKNAGFKKFFTVTNKNNIEVMFEWDWFLNAGAADSKAVYYDIVHDMSPVSKDIFLYESVIDNDAESTKDIYAFDPVITKKGKLIYHFFYDPNHFKYRGLPNAAK